MESMLLGKPVTEMVNIVIAGMDSAERASVAECLTSMKYPFERKTVRITRQLPLPPNEDRPRVDFIVILLDMANRLSYEAVLGLLGNLPVEYTPARSMLLVVNAQTPGRFAVPLACLAISRKCMATLRMGGVSSLFGTCMHNEIVRNTEMHEDTANEVEVEAL